MADRVVQEYSNLCDAFAEMRKEMRRRQKYFGKGAATDKLYEAIRQFAPAIELAPPCIPIEDDNEYIRARD